MKITGRFAIVCLLTQLLTTTIYGDMFLNGGFEGIPGPGTGQALMPSNWVSINQSADTYSSDGSYGLFPWEFGNFPGVTAHGGLRWVAGANINQVASGEIFGQVLASNLIAGRGYRVSAWLHQAIRSDLNNPGGYDLWLDKGDFFTDRLFVGHLGDTISPAAGWNLFADEFVAPLNAAEYTRFVFAPIAAGLWGAYPGIDDVSLMAIPEPTGLALWLAPFVVASYRRKRHS